MWCLTGEGKEDDSSTQSLQASLQMKLMLLMYYLNQPLMFLLSLMNSTILVKIIDSVCSDTINKMKKREYEIKILHIISLGI